jgi:phenylacetate-coenzyme A ligase PaaK-like adenylate-forming protein
MSYVDTLIDRRAFDYCPETEDLFIRALHETVSHHYARCQEYRKFLDYCHFQPVIRSREDIIGLPALHVNVFKEHDLVSVPREEVVLSLTSSGTSGKKSKNFLDDISLRRVKKIARNVYDALGMVDDGEFVNYCCFTYDPHVAKDLGTAFTDELLTGFTARKRVYYTFQYSQATGGFEFDLPQVARIFEEFEQEGLPVRLLGFPAFIAEALEYYYSTKKKTLKFHPRSFLMTGGGWKKREDKKVSRAEFVQFIHDMSDVPHSNVRDLFGMVEHGVPYVECSLGNMHVPIYAKISIKDPRTLQNLPYGEVGLPNFITPYLHSYPSISILVNDFAFLEPGCSCGLKGEVLRIVGRAGTTKHVGCAMHAEDTVQKR